MDDVLAIDIKAAARKISCSRSYLYTEMASGRLAYLKVGKRRLIRPADLAIWLDQHAIGSVTGVPAAKASPN